MKIWPVLTVLMLGFLAGCWQRSDEIVIVIEDPDLSRPSERQDSTEFNGRERDRTTSLTGVVRLLSRDLESGEIRMLLRHADLLSRALEKELEGSMSRQRRRVLNLFYLKLGNLKRQVQDLKADIPPTQRIRLASLLDELQSLAQRIEGG